VKPSEGDQKKIVSKKNTRRSKTNLGPTNIIRISPLGLTNKLKLHYEKVVSTRSAFGIAAALYYSDQDRGSAKIEPHYKFYTSNTAPTGTYIIGGPTIFMLNNYNFRYTAASEQQAVILANQPFYNAVTREQLITTIQQKSFTSIGGCLGFGYQFVFGRSNNFVLDFAAGYQYVNIPSNVKEPVTKEHTYKGTGNTYTYNVNYLFSDRKNFFGITSPIFTRFSVGILF
jgi:hypothetical protein